jgi:hypothetical protein
MQGHSTPRAKDWADWFHLHRNDRPRPLKGQIARQLGLTPAEFSKRIYADVYQPAVSDNEVQITAEMWNQSPDYVRKLFPRIAA